MERVRRSGMGAARRGLGAVAVLLAAALLVPHRVPAQEAPGPILEPLPRPLDLYLSERPRVTVEFSGDYGVSVLTGTLEAAPDVRLRGTTPSGETQEVPFREVARLSVTQRPFEGLPIGSVTVRLITDPAAFTETSYGAMAPVGEGIAAGQPVFSLRVDRLPEGELTLAGPPYGRIRIPLSRVLSYALVPIEVRTAELPEGNLRVELFPGTVISVPLRSVERMYRNLREGTVLLRLAEGQQVAGRLVELPDVALVVGEPPAQERIPLSSVVVLERPALRRF